MSFPDFNSIKVRLELTVLCIILHIFRYFNSIKVRLEPASFSAPQAVSTFQFHKGTIRTFSASWFRTLTYSHFNSIKVRLERFLFESLPLSPSFQFHKGTIRTYINLTVCTIIINFNSIKVRLELPFFLSHQQEVLISIP